MRSALHWIICMLAAACLVLGTIGVVCGSEDVPWEPAAGAAGVTVAAAADAAQDAAEAEGIELKALALSALAWVWQQLGTPQGLAAIAGMFSWLIAKLFTRKPKWKEYFDKYKGTMLSAVKLAEKEIPDGTENKSMARADQALKYILSVHQELNRASAEDLKQALSVVHDEAEAAENL